MNGKALTVCVLGFGLLLGALITQNGNLALMALPFLAYLAVGILGSPRGEEIRLTASRTVSFSQASGAASIKMRVTARNDGVRSVLLRLSDPLPPAATITGGDLRAGAALKTGETARLEYAFRAERGDFQWKTLHAEVSDLFALFETTLELPAPAQVLVQPRMKKFKPFSMRPDSTLHSPGLIPARISGSGTDFWGVREYHPGDPLRRLDWRRTARHPFQIFTKEFEQEEVADIGLVLDARRAADVRCGDDSLFEHTLRAAASLAEVFLRRGNRTSLLVVGSRTQMVHPGYGKTQLNRILRSLAKARTGTERSRFTLDSAALRMFGSRALIVILSPLTASDWQVFPRLRAHGNQGLLICPDTVDFTKKNFQDAPGLLALRAARLERLLELRRIARLGIRVIDWQVHRPLSPLVRNALRTAHGPQR